jgi:hypothetical protein
MRAEHPVVGLEHRAPATLAGTRDALHRLAVYAVSPAREAATGRIGLRAAAAPAVLATPPFGDDERQILVHAGALEVRNVDGTRHRPLGSLADAAAWLGVEIDPTRPDRFDVPPPGDVDAPLAVDPEAARWLGEWYRFADSVLEGLRAGCTAADSADEVQLWPEHFDLACAAGEADRRRATFGCSPGDAHVPEPYAYIAPWTRDHLDDPFWGEGPFAALPHARIAGAGSRGTALAFFRRGLELLRAR